MVPPASRRVSRAPRYSGFRCVGSVVAPTGLSPSLASLSRPFGFLNLPLSRPYNPRAALTARVWAGPFSLAATRGVACLFSPPAATKMFQFAAFASVAGSPFGGVTPFGYPGVIGCLRLARAFRRLSRPSSPLGAWASSVRPCSLLFAGAAALSGCAAPRSLAQYVNVRRRPVAGRSPGRDAAPVKLSCSARPRGGPLQKGGVPAAPSGTATLLRLSPSRPFRPWPLLAVTAFRRPGLPWLDGRCVQGPGTYSPRHG